MPKRHVVEPLIPPDEVVLRNGKHILSKIDSSFGKLNFEERRVAKKFFMSLVPDGYKLAEGKSRFWTGIGFGITAFQAYFYRPGVPCGEKHRFNAPCNYEVLIPYSSAQDKALRYWIVPAGSEPGDIVVSLNPPPIHYGPNRALNNLYSPLKPNSEKTFFVDQVRAVLKNFVELKDKAQPFKEAFGVWYGVMTIPDEPCIRLPCYNVPLQCAYEMVNAEVGDLGHFMLNVEHSQAAWKAVCGNAQRNENALFVIKRKPLDRKLFTAMYLWFGWELNDRKLSAMERFDLLIESMKACGESFEFGQQTTSSQALTLKKGCDKLFKTHMKTVREGLRIRSEVLNRNVYVIRKNSNG